MNLSPRIGLISLCLCAATAAADPAAPKSVDVRDLMSVSQFHQAGLDKLTRDELQALNVWLNNYVHPSPVVSQGATAPSAAIAPVPAPIVAPPATQPIPAPPAATGTAAFGQDMLPKKKDADSQAPDVLESRILGDFQGWSGRGIFKLENGQVWVQTDSSSFDTNLHDPTVVIKKTGLGHYLLTLPGHGGSVFVKRVQ